MKLTVAIISQTSKPNEILLRSVAFADEIIIIIDSPAVSRPSGTSTSSSPATAGLTPPTKIFHHSLNNDFATQRNFALQKAKSDWVFFVDDDEYVGAELVREIQAVIKSSTQSAGYLVPRLDLVFHQPLHHGETGHLSLLRLARRTAGKFSRPVHEFWRVRGRVGELSAPLYHLKDHFISEFLGRVSRYGQIDSKVLSREGKPFSWFRLFIYPPAKFLNNYFLKAGFLDGTVGLFQAYLMGLQSLSTRIFQWSNQK
jgi:glycosyltransferase involved in cell wall biosynthesis